MRHSEKVQKRFRMSCFFFETVVFIGLLKSLVYWHVIIFVKGQPLDRIIISKSYL